MTTTIKDILYDIAQDYKVHESQIENEKKRMHLLITGKMDYLVDQFVEELKDSSDIEETVEEYVEYFIKNVIGG